MHLQAKGRYSKQAHVSVPEGLYEEEFGEDGFYGPVSHLYHQHEPTGWTRIEGPLRPHAFDGNALAEVGPGDVIPDRVTLFHNPDVRVQLSRPSQTYPWCFRNADGDEVFFIHVGQGTLESDFGSLQYAEGDYLVIPRGTTYRFCPETTENCFLVFEARSHVEEPARGILGQHALYDPGVIETPNPQPYEQSSNLPASGEWEIRIKRLDTLTSVFYPYNPMDVVGWKGTLSVWKLNIQDIRPVMSHRVHLPPSVHTTLKGNGFVVCTFLPRPLESDPTAVRVPFYHRNIDYDELIFYHRGDFFSRDGIKPGWFTMHPQGIHHGPHPKARHASQQKTHTEEMAVMLDTEKPLIITPEAAKTEWADYWRSWQVPEAPPGAHAQRTL